MEKGGDYHLNFSEVHSFLGQIKDSEELIQQSQNAINKIHE